MQSTGGCRSRVGEPLTSSWGVRDKSLKNVVSLKPKGWCGRQEGHGQGVGRVLMTQLSIRHGLWATNQLLRQSEPQFLQQQNGEKDPGFTGWLWGLTRSCLLDIRQTLSP